MITFNDVQLKEDEIFKRIEPLMPATKTKIVCFSMLNAIPFHAWLLKGVEPRMGGERQESTLVRTYIDGFGEGMMQYYTSVKQISPKGGSAYLEYSPKFITFSKQAIIFDAKKNPSLFFFLTFHPANERNSEKAGTVPLFRFINPKEKATKTVASMDLEIDALQAVKKLKDEKPSRLRMIYEVTGGTEWDEYISVKDKNWAAIMEPLYAACKVDPQNILNLIGDESLDVDALIVNAIAKGIVVHNGNAFYWGDQVKADLINKKITNIPKGKGSNAQAWFVTWLKDQKVELEEVQTEMDVFKETQKS